MQTSATMEHDPTLNIRETSFVDYMDGDDDFDGDSLPSKATMDRSLAAKMYIEQHYANLLQTQKERGER
jgi:hypothetical protein